MKYSLRLVLIAFAFLVVLTRNAWAYIDPGTGSYIFQILIAFLVGAGYVVKTCWSRIALFFSNLFSKRKP